MPKLKTLFWDYLTFFCRNSFTAVVVRFFFIFYILISLTQHIVYSQNFHVRNYSENDGLPSNTVYSIVQDHRGYLWFATRSGIASYDGRDWIIYKNVDGLPTSSYQKIMVDDHGTVWAATNFIEEMVASFQGNQWKSFPGPENFPRDQNFFFDVTIRADKPILAIGHSLMGLFVREEAQWRHFGEPEGLVGTRPRGLVSRFGRIYVATDRGLTVLDEHGAHHELNLLLQEPYRNLTGIALEEKVTPPSPDSPFIIWLLGRDWVGTITGNRFQVLAKMAPFSSPQQTMLKPQPDLAGGLFFGHLTRIHHYRGTTGKVVDFGKDNPIISGATDLFMDREKNFWISGLRGVHKIGNMRFANYYRAQGLLEDEVTAILEWKPDKWLLGHDSGFSFFDGADWRTIALPNLDAEKQPFTRVMDLRSGFEGEAWAALSQSGVARIDQDLNLHIYESGDGNQIYSVLPDPATGRVWLGGRRGLYVLEGDQIYYVDEPNAPKKSIRRLARGAGDQLYAGTAGGGLLVKDREWRAYTAPNPQANQVYTVLEDSRGQVWVGTLAGLYQLLDGVLKPFYYNGFQIRKPIYLIVEDHMNRLWFGTDHGVFRFDGKTAQHFTIDQGLAGQETNRAAGMTDHGGRVWIGTDSGVSLYQEHFDHKDLPPPLLELKKVEVSGETYSPHKALELTHGENDLVFHFKAISFIDENDLWYQCRLTGYDTEWLPVLRSEYRQMRYTNLNPGRYQFQVKARNARGIWAAPISSATITIQKPFWGSWWFISLMTMLALGILYSVSDYVSSKRYSSFLEAQVAQRTHELEGKIVQHQQAEAQIQTLNQELEVRIEQRTAELEAAHKGLVESAHCAGMAEIATSMLHNVGNILNSVSTSGYLLRASLESSRVGSLVRANQLLNKHLANFDTFIQQNRQGKQLLRFYLSLGDILEKENRDLSKNVQALLEKINTIKDVIIAQNNYATGVFQNEVLRLEDLVEASLNILSASLAKKDIQVEKRYAPVTEVTIQKTKVIHTLVNILKNAKESIVLSGSPVKKITISIGEKDGVVLLTITDTGRGISKADVKKIFNHGFTTKQGGHGFGLHSCANAMHEMGGAIWVESMGEGQGASFTLRFPSPQKAPDG